MLLALRVEAAPNDPALSPTNSPTSLIPIAAKPVWRVSGGVDAMGGHSTYGIGGRVNYADGSTTVAPFPVSELVFPMQVFLAAMTVEAELARTWRFRADVGMNITDQAGVMTDSDWGTNPRDIPNEDYRPGSLDIYSTSDADLNSLMASVSLQRRVLTRDGIALFAGAGYMYRHLDWTTSHLDQWEPAWNEYLGEDAGHITWDGHVLTYQVWYRAAFLEMSAEKDVGDHLRLELDLRYMPWVDVEDQDNHLVRNPPIRAIGEHTGPGVGVTVRGRYALKGRKFLSAKAEYLIINANGTRQNYLDGVWAWETESRVETEQVALEVALGCQF